MPGAELPARFGDPHSHSQVLQQDFMSGKETIFFQSDRETSHDGEAQLTDRMGAQPVRTPIIIEILLHAKKRQKKIF